MRHVVRTPDQELRLDRWLRLQLPFLPQSFLQSQLRKRQIRLQSDASHFGATRANSVLREGSVVAIDARLFQSMKANAQTELRLEATRRNETMGTSGDMKRAKRLSQRVVYQDAHFVVLDKPQGLAVQVMGSGSCQQAKNNDDDDQQETLRLVHRLDKEMSGVLVLVLERSRLATANFSVLLRSGAVHKTYEALVARRSSKGQSCSSWKEWEGQEVHDPVDGKTACTLVERVLQRNHDRYTEHSGRTAWLQLRPRTGRKH
uniref:Pseudouridine synthase RsuA/RluA-like domain-containing protein n=1 Tax=Hyaloperonospora arabidopsidis (strain Emoy2) TaxID=559515 RepID=M4B2X7_HYAAE